MLPRPATRSAVVISFALGIASLLAACASAVPVPAAPYASDPECARVMLAAPESLGGLPMRATTSQATAAYGEDFAIIVRCGVEPPGPSDEPCVEVTTGSTTLGWLISERDDAWVAVSFGRSPTVEATIPKVRADNAVGDLLAELSPSAALAPPNGLECR
jgi:hypothetical protein